MIAYAYKRLRYLSIHSLNSRAMKIIRRHHIRRQCLTTGFILSALIIYWSLTAQQTELFSNNRILRTHLPSTQQQSSVSLCPPKKHIMFLKTHKCASTAVQNIFLRYGYRRNLTFALSEEDNYLGSPQLFKASMIPSSLMPPNGLVDIFCVHTRLNELELQKVLHKDTVWITIIRNPVAIYESFYNFYDLSNFYKLSLEDFGTRSLSDLTELPRLYGRTGYNHMLFDFGALPNISTADLQRYLKKLDALFDLVMIVERIDESLILLKHLLCWNMEDVVVFTKNARRNELKQHLSNATVRTLRDLNRSDLVLYNYFLARHEREVTKFGEKKLKREAEQLRRLTGDYYKYCVRQKVTGQDSRLSFKEASKAVTSYLLAKKTSQICRLMIMPEISFINMVRSKQQYNIAAV